jgi:hypothetical protein
VVSLIEDGICGVGERLFQVPFDRLQHRLQILKNRAVFKPKHSHMKLFQNPCARIISLGGDRVKMGLTVQLHGQPTLGTTKVDDVIADAVSVAEDTTPGPSSTEEGNSCP